MAKVSPSKTLTEKTTEKISKLSKVPGEKYLKKLEFFSSQKKRKWLSKLVLHPDSIYRLSWDVIILSLLIYQSLTIPYFICFNQDYPDPLQIFELVTYLIFFFDIFLSFNTGFYVKGSLVLKRKEIAKDYLRLWFWVDLISTFPYTWIFEGVYPTTSISQTGTKGAYNAPRIIRVIKIIRFLRILRLLRLAKLKKILIKIEDYIASSTLSNLFVLGRLLSMTILGAHWIACLWFFVGTYDPENHPLTWVNNAGIQDEPPMSQYINSLYWAFTTISTIGYGDIVPITMVEKIFAMLTMIAASGVFAYAIGSIGALLSKHTALEDQYREIFVAVNSYLKRKNLPKDLRLRVKRYLDYIWEKKKKNKIDEKELLNLLSEPLRDEIYSYINANVIKYCKIFDNYELNFISHITRSLESETYAPGDVIFEEGEMSHKIYYIMSGSVEIFHQSTSMLFSRLQHKQYFGEIAFFLENKRCASARCPEFADFLSLSRSDFDLFLEKFPEAKFFTDSLSQKCRQGDYSNLLVKCFICEEIGHVATCCKSVLINLDLEETKKNWLENKENKETVLVKVDNFARLRRGMKRKVKRRYVIGNVIGKPRGSIEMFPNNQEISKIIHKVADFSKFEEEVHSTRPSDTKGKIPVLRPRYSLFFSEQSELEINKKNAKKA